MMWKGREFDMSFEINTCIHYFSWSIFFFFFRMIVLGLSFPHCHGSVHTSATGSEMDIYVAWLSSTPPFQQGLEHELPLGGTRSSPLRVCVPRVG